MILHVSNESGIESYHLLKVVRKWPEDVEQAMYIDGLRNKNNGIFIFQDVNNYLICEEIEVAVFSEMETKD